MHVVFSSLDATAPELVPGVHLAPTGEFQIDRAPPSKSSNDGTAGGSPMGGSASTVASRDKSADHDGNLAAPSHTPLPAPESPATGVTGSGGTSFVPIAALLALLALVAPATTRRLGRAADFRMPTPFVCALERPG
jgi:hypothetical protein